MKQLSKNWVLIVLLLLIGQQVFSYDFEVNGIYYGYNVTKQTAYVTSGEKKYSGNINIPSTVSYNGRVLSVSEVGFQAFMACPELLSVSLPNSILSIGSEAFSCCDKLSMVNQSNCLETIGAHAFEGCYNLSLIELPNSLNLIEMYAFSRTGIESVIIPPSVKQVGMYAFSGCINLRTFILSDSDNSITFGSSTLGGGQGDIFYDAKPKHLYIGRPIVLYDFYQYDFADSLTTLAIGNYMKSPEDYIVLSDNIRRLYLDRTKKLEHIYSMSVNPAAINDYCFDSSVYLNAKLYVPIGTKDKYLSVNGWKNFFNIQEMDVADMWNGQGEPPTGDNPHQQKCEKPIIHYSNGKLSFECATDGATCQSTITDTDIASYSENEIQLSVTYNISVYASKAGYDNSDIVTATLCWIDADPKTEGIESGVAQVRANAVLIQSHDGTVSVEGVADGTDITIYDTSGQMVGSTKAHCNYTTIATNLRNGSVAIVRVGDKSLKIIMK